MHRQNNINSNWYKLFFLCSLWSHITIWKCYCFCWTSAQNWQKSRWDCRGWNSRRKEAKERKETNHARWCPWTTVQCISFQTRKYGFKKKKIRIGDISLGAEGVARRQHYPHWIIIMCCSRKCLCTPPTEGLLAWKPPPPIPAGNSILVSYFPLNKNWSFETLIPFGISVNLPWGGYGYFLELHNTRT